MGEVDIPARSKQSGQIWELHRYFTSLPHGEPQDSAFRSSLAQQFINSVTYFPVTLSRRRRVSVFCLEILRRLRRLRMTKIGCYRIYEFCTYYSEH